MCVAIERPSPFWRMSIVSLSSDSRDSALRIAWMRTRGWSQVLTTMRPFTLSIDTGVPARRSRVRSNGSCSLSAWATPANTIVRMIERMVLRMAASTNSLRTLERRVALALILLLMVVFIHDRLNGPPTDDTPGRFSAAEAFDELKALLAEGVPHPVESAANHVVRDRIIQRFRDFGYSPVIQRARACNHRGS